MGSPHTRNNLIIKKWILTLTIFLAILLTVGYTIDRYDESHSENMIMTVDEERDRTVKLATLPTERTYLEQRSDIATFAGGAGTVFFAAVAAGAYGVAKSTCNAAAITAIVTFNASGAVACVGAYMVGALASAISAGIAAVGAGHGWQWWKGSGLAERSNEVSYYSGILGNTFYGGMMHTADAYDTLRYYLGDAVDDLTYVSVLYDNSTGLVKRDSAPVLVSWSTNHTGWPVTTLVSPDQLAASAKEYMNTFKGAGYMMARDSHEWASYNTYGLNSDFANVVTDNLQQDAEDVYIGLGNMVVDHFDDCTMDECYAIQNKVCLAAGQSSEAGQNSDIVGEVYFASYGGVDNECDSL